MGDVQVCGRRLARRKNKKPQRLRRGFSPRDLFEYQALAASVAVVAAASVLSASDQLR